MTDASPTETIIRRVEVATVVAVELLLVAAVFAATDTWAGLRRRAA